MKYKINFDGFAYVEANSAEEADDKFVMDDCVYSELCVESIEEVDDFVVGIIDEIEQLKKKYMK